MTQSPLITQALIGISLLVVLFILIYRAIKKHRDGLKLTLEMTKSLKEAVKTIDQPIRNTEFDKDLAALEELATHKLINQKQLSANQARLKKLYDKK